MKYDDVTTNPI